MAKEETINVTLTLPKSQVEYLDRQASTEDMSRSQVARRIIRKDMDINAALKQRVQAKSK